MVCTVYLMVERYFEIDSKLLAMIILRSKCVNFTLSDVVAVICCSLVTTCAFY